MILILFAQVFGFGLSRAQSVNMAGNWGVEITFSNGESRSLRLEAQGSGKGSFQLGGPKAAAWGPAGPWEAKWSQEDNGSVTVSGTVEFPLGNVGRDAGTLVLKGSVGKEGAMQGEAAFFPLGQDPNDPKARASKSGTFKAIRTEGR